MPQVEGFLLTCTTQLILEGCEQMIYVGWSSTTCTAQLALLQGTYAVLAPSSVSAISKQHQCTCSMYVACVCLQIIPAAPDVALIWMTISECALGPFWHISSAHSATLLTFGLLVSTSQQGPHHNMGGEADLKLSV